MRWIECWRTVGMSAAGPHPFFFSALLRTSNVASDPELACLSIATTRAPVIATIQRSLPYAQAMPGAVLFRTFRGVTTARYDPAEASEIAAKE
jgi:hypothetical protein